MTMSMLLPCNSRSDTGPSHRPCVDIEISKSFDAKRFLVSEEILDFTRLERMAHTIAQGQCRVCVSCSTCTGFGAACVCQTGSRSQDRGEHCGCGVGSAGCSECGRCAKCAESSLCPRNLSSHFHTENVCRVCTMCGYCTGFGRQCVKHHGVNREHEGGQKCGCGQGHAGCGRCGMCLKCSRNMTCPRTPPAQTSSLAASHSFALGKCQVCTRCFGCTGYGKRCLKHFGQIRDADAGKECGCGEGDAGCRTCGMCKNCAKVAICGPKTTAPPGTGHEFVISMCRVCVDCGTCTGYGSSCIAHKRRDRSSEKGHLCGCGGGDAGCRHCGRCRRCAASQVECGVPTKQEHDMGHSHCRVCTACGACTGFGRNCIKHKGQDRSQDKGEMCGCGGGPMGCRNCGMCPRCVDAAPSCPGTLSHPPMMSHSFAFAECRVCVQCSGCTGAKQCDRVHLEGSRGQPCGCGEGEAGCVSCGKCLACGLLEVCAGVSQVFQVPEVPQNKSPIILSSDSSDSGSNHANEVPEEILEEPEKLLEVKTTKAATVPQASTEEVRAEGDSESVEELKRKNQQLEEQLAALKDFARSTPAPAEDEDMLCVICVERRRGIILRPCHHICFCPECITEFLAGRSSEECICPMCRAQIQGHDRVFL